MEVLAANGDEALVLTGFLLLFAGIVLLSQVSSAPTCGAKGGRQTASAIFLMGSLSVFCLVWGKALGREMRCLPIK